MSVVVACEDTGPCSKKLTIEVPAEAVEAEFGRVIGEYRKELRMPGFRRGKVPAGLVRKRFGADIEREVAERLVPRYWRQAQAEQDLDPLVPPRFEEFKVHEGEPLSLVAEVETRPEIELGDIREFKLPEDRVEPLDEEVEAALDDVRRQFAIWKPTERSAASGDIVVLKIQETDAGEEGEAGDGESLDGRTVHIEIGADGVEEELNLALSGLSAGQGTDYEGPLGGRESKSYRLDVTEVRELELPELDDELARKVGEFESAAELREVAQKDLRRRREADLRRRREQAVLEQLRERHPLTLPERVVQRESEEMVQQQAHYLASQGIDVEKAEIDWSKHLEQARPQAEKRVHDRLLLDAIAKAEGVRLDESEFERFLASLAAQQGVSTAELRQHLSQTERIESIRSDLLRQQTLQGLIGADDAEATGDVDGAAEAPDGGAENS